MTYQQYTSQNPNGWTNKMWSITPDEILTQPKPGSQLMGHLGNIGIVELTRTCKIHPQTHLVGMLTKKTPVELQNFDTAGMIFLQAFGCERCEEEKRNSYIEKKGGRRP
jgi:hypothetical protein